MFVQLVMGVASQTHALGTKESCACATPLKQITWTCRIMCLPTKHAHAVKVALRSHSHSPDPLPHPGDHRQPKKPTTNQQGPTAATKNNDNDVELEMFSPGITFRQDQDETTLVGRGSASHRCNTFYNGTRTTSKFFNVIFLFFLT